jgi:restriction endonuclease
VPLLKPLFDAFPEPLGDEPKWLVYQKAVAQLKASYGDCEVVHDYKILGRPSGVERQVDIWFSTSIGGKHGVTVAVECKCHVTTPVSIKDVDAFYGFLDDVGANKGVLVSNTGFTEGAKRRADGCNLELETLTLEEAEDFEWAEYLSDNCQVWGGECLAGQIRWELENSEGDRAGYCSECGSLHIKCAECGAVVAYDRDEINCDGCDVKWELERRKGEVEGLHRMLSVQPDQHPISFSAS